MQSGFFWKNWASPYREIYTLLIVLLVIALGATAYYYIQGIEGILGWSIAAETKPIEIGIENFKIGPFQLEIAAESKVFTQKFLGNLPEVSVLSYLLFLVITTICLNVLITVITTLPRFWYFVGVSLLVIMLVNLKLELLYLFGSESKTGLIIALALFLPTTYYFNAIKPSISLLWRFVTFLLITAVLTAIIAIFSQVASPFLHLASYGLINPFILALVFILMVAHEIVAAFVYFLTKSNYSPGSTNSLLHFTLITLIYLANLFLAYLHETNIIDWDFLYINLFLLLGISTILGIFFYAHREELYKTLFSFKPIGAFFFASMAIICFTTIAHFMATGNDPALEVIRDIIIYGHLGYGLIFAVYVFANFMDPLKRGLQVYKVLYKPISMPWFTFRLAGLIAFIAFFVKSNWEVPVNQGFAAYYNSLGDLHKEINQGPVAEHYYRQGSMYGLNNHKSNYSLAAMAHRQENADKAIERYVNATLKNPSPQSFINLSSIHVDKNQFFDALFTLQKGHEVFPENGEILNNLGLLYAKTNVLDTAAVFIDKAANIGSTKATASSNMLSLLALNDIPVHPDSVVAEYDIKRDPISINNSLVLKNKLGLASDETFQANDSALTFVEASILYNIAFNHLFQKDSLHTQAIMTFSEMPGNLNYRERLQLVAALNLEKNGDINGAFRKLNWLANSSPTNSGEYFNLVGLMALKHEAPYVAAQYFNWAIDRQYKTAELNKAIALTENMNQQAAVAQWQRVIEEKRFSLNQLSRTIIELLTSDYNMLESDAQRYLYLRYNINYQDTVTFDELISKIADENYKALALFDMTKKLWHKDQIERAVNYYTKIGGLKITDQHLFEKIQWLELKMLAAQGNIRGLAQKINQGIAFTQDRWIEKAYYTALISEASGDTTNAKNNYEAIAYKDPFFPESVIAAANFFNTQDRFKAYDILLSALEINPKSVKLLKAYILQCARIENTSYAQIGLEDLSKLISSQELNNFKTNYQKLAQKVKEEAENF